MSVRVSGPSRRMRGRRMRGAWCAAAAAAVSWWGPALADPSIIQPGLRAWSEAAKTGRADTWLLGDSVIASFDAGFNAAIGSHYGLAGTGVWNDFLSVDRNYAIVPPYPLGSQ